MFIKYHSQSLNLEHNDSIAMFIFGRLMLVEGLISCCCAFPVFYQTQDLPTCCADCAMSVRSSWKWRHIKYAHSSHNFYRGEKVQHLAFVFDCESLHLETEIGNLEIGKLERENIFFWASVIGLSAPEIRCRFTKLYKATKLSPKWAKSLLSCQ